MSRLEHTETNARWRYDWEGEAKHFRHVARTLAAEADELHRRLDAVVAMLEPGDKPNCMGSKYNPAGRISIYDADRMVYDARHRDHARAVAIAEGRDNG